MNITVNNVSLNYEVIGQGTPLLMVHGNGEDHHIFEEAASVLKDKFTCYLIDSRGHGQSEEVDSFTYDAMAEDMAEFIKALDLKDVTFYGFSDGGIIGLLLASNYPELVKTLIISGANITPRGVKDIFHYLFKAIYCVKKDPLIELMLTQPNISTTQLGKIKCRTLVLAGAKDLIKEEETKLIAASIPRATLKILKGEGHGSYIVNSKKIARIILAYHKRIAE